MQILEAVNLVLRRLGEVPVTSVDEQYPTLAVALPALDEARRRILAESWWFNTYKDVTLAPNLAGEVLVPESTLWFYPDETDLYTYAGRNVRLASTGSKIVSASVVGRVVLDIPFEELPETAQYAVAYKAAYDTYIGDVGDDATAKVIGTEFAAAYSELGAAHTRQRKATSRLRAQANQWRHMRNN